MGLSRLVGMATHDDMESSGGRIQVKSVHIVEQVEEDVACLCDGCFGQAFCPMVRIHVSPHGNDGCKLSQSSKNFGLTYVTSMENQVGATKGFQSLWAQQAVSIRNEANPRGFSLHGGILMLCVPFQNQK